MKYIFCSNSRSLYTSGPVGCTNVSKISVICVGAFEAEVLRNFLTKCFRKRKQ